MNSAEEIINKKISLRIIRKKSQPLKKIDLVLSEVCNILNLPKPKLVFCDTLVRRISSFELYGNDYLIFDNSILEFIHNYNKIIFSGAVYEDIDKFYYKVLCEECLFRELPEAFVCYREYVKREYSFDKILEQKSNKHITLQVYFLFIHEMTHLAIKNNKLKTQFLIYKKSFFESLFFLVNEFDGEYISKSLLELFGLRINCREFDLESLLLSENMDSFIEECFCDFNAYSLMIDNFDEQNISFAVNNLVNFLVNDEYVRVQFEAESEEIKIGVGESLLMALIRLHLFTLTIIKNQTINEDCGSEIYDKINDRCENVIKSINDLPKTPDHLFKVRDELISILHEISIEDEL